MWGLFYVGEIIKLSIVTFGVLGYQSRKKLWLLLNVVAILSIIIIEITVPTEDLIYLVSFLPVFVIGISFVNIRKVIIMIPVFLVYSIVSLLFEGIYGLIFGYTVEQMINNPLLMTIANIISVVFYIILWLVIKYSNKGSVFSKGINIKLKEILIVTISMIGVMLYVAPIQLIGLLESNNKLKVYSLLGVTISGVVFLCVSIYMLFIRSDKKYYKNLYEMNEVLLLQQKNYYQKVLDNEKETKKFRHDIMNHLMCISSLQANERYNDVTKYIEGLVDSVEDLHKCTITGNPTLNIVIEDVLKKSLDIKIDVIGKFPEKVNLTDMELCTMFSNLFLNAVTAVQELDPTKKIITFETSCFEKSLIIKISNPVSKKAQINNNIPITSKKDKSIHGFGSMNIREVVEKYSGDIKYSCDDEKFEVEIYLDNILL